MYFRYDKVTQKNDITLIRLQRPVNFRRGIRPVCLPEKYEGFNFNRLNEEPTVIGWGTTGIREPISSHLRETNVPLVDQDSCVDKYVEFGRNIGSTQFCAGDENRDSCRGDSGGPLIVSKSSTDDTAVVIGVTSFGPSDGCGTKDLPSVYA